MRRGREFYDGNYEKAVVMHKEGKSVREIASQLKISYSAAYHWVKGLRKPEAGNITEFVAFLRSKGPMPAAELQDSFPKHNELFLISSRRRLGVRRCILDRKLKEYATWYFIDGQEKELDKRVRKMFSMIREFSGKLA